MTKTTTYLVQQLNLATRQTGTVLRTENLQEALARINRPGSSYMRVVIKTGRTVKVVASRGAARTQEVQ